MDEANNHQLGAPTGVLNRTGHDEPKQCVQYSIPGILHYLQHEWTRFEMERSQWELEKAELQAKIAFLNGERKGQENFKNDLVRRIKMLEFALKQERAKYHKLKYGTDLVQGDLNPPQSLIDDGVLLGITEDVNKIDSDEIMSSNSNVSWKQSRQLLRQYLQEIGYTDTIIDLRSNRVRSLLGLGSSDSDDLRFPIGKRNDKEYVGTYTTKPVKNTKTVRELNETTLEAQIRDAEKAVIKNFDFLNQDGLQLDDSEDDDGEEEEDDDIHSRLKPSKPMEDDEVDSEVVDEFNYMHMPSNMRITSEMDGGSFNLGPRRPFVSGNEDDSLEGLGELAQLTVTNEADTSFDISSSKENSRKTWTARYTLRSHFDGVRALCFHPTEACLITASEDATLKLWNLQKTVPAKKSTSLDVEPIYTFRGHIGPVLSLSMIMEGEKCYAFSGGLDSTIRIWNVPSTKIDPYDSYVKSVGGVVYNTHEDAVWGLVYNNQQSHLLSCSADSTVRLWSFAEGAMSELSCNVVERDGTPTSVDFVYESPHQYVCSFTNSNCVIYDIETCKPVIKFDATSEASSVSQDINKVVSHPTLPLTITAHEDRHIRFWDNNSGRLVQSMVAHLDSVTSLAVDPDGLYLLSGSHDCSIRLWQLESKQCVQEITAHRKKFDESIFDVAFHPSKPYIASAGADALAKVFV